MPQRAKKRTNPDLAVDRLPTEPQIIADERGSDLR